LALLPYAFYLTVAGQASPIVTGGHTDFRLITLSRIWSFLGDLNQGMLPYVPLLLVLDGIVFCQLLGRRHWKGLGAFAVIGLVILACAPIQNWNSASAGMMRYAVWVVPILAWIAAEHLNSSSRLAGLARVAIAVQGIILSLRQRKTEPSPSNPVSAIRTGKVTLLV
jgi:hypothetical protein